MPKKAKQIAAMPLRWDKDGKVEILMVTSRDSGRWIMPKGWVMRGKKPWVAAEIEAFEEAGALGEISREAICNYTYKKRMPKGAAIKCDVDVYPMRVKRLKSKWKEQSERKRKWFSVKRAAKRISEPELALLLEALAKKPNKQPLIQEFMRAA